MCQARILRFPAFPPLQSCPSSQESDESFTKSKTPKMEIDSIVDLELASSSGGEVFFSPIGQYLAHLLRDWMIIVKTPFA